MIKEAERIRKALFYGQPVVRDDLLNAYRAGVAWDWQEYVRLRDWYAQWGHILTKRHSDEH